MASHTVSSTEGRLADSHLTRPRTMQLWTTSLLVYEQAKDLDVPGRSKMTKEELAEAVTENS